MMWAIPWKRSGYATRDDIGEKYLAYLRASLMNLPSPHVGTEYTGQQLIDLQKALAGITRADGALTMIGEDRLAFLSMAIRDLHERRVPGDLLEAGAWKGGACIYMRAALDVYGILDRTVWVCDAFDDGFPAPDARFPVDADSKLHLRSYFKTSNVMVKQYFRCYGYDDRQVKIVPGYFKDSLPAAGIGKLALLRLDGDLYGSTWDALEACYDKVSPGGYIIEDDYQHIKHARQAIDDFRSQRGITDPLHSADWASVYWIKEAR